MGYQDYFFPNLNFRSYYVRTFLSPNECQRRGVKTLETYAAGKFRRHTSITTTKRVQSKGSFKKGIEREGYKAVGKGPT